MAMTIREKNAFKALQDQLDLLKALRFTQEIYPDIQPPVDGSYKIEGWLFSIDNPANPVFKAWTTGHASGRVADLNTFTRHNDYSQPLYSSEELAYRALRNTLENKYAAHLFKIDQTIQTLTGK